MTKCLCLVEEGVLLTCSVCVKVCRLLISVKRQSLCILAESIAQASLKAWEGEEENYLTKHAYSWKAERNEGEELNQPSLLRVSVLELNLKLHNGNQISTLVA